MSLTSEVNLTDYDLQYILKHYPNKFTKKPKPTLEDIIDIESLDPDKRRWYYDGDGMEGKKE